MAKLCDMMCVSYGKTADVCFSGGADGNIFIWNGLVLQKVVKAHDGPVFAMHSLDKVSCVCVCVHTCMLVFYVGGHVNMHAYVCICMSMCVYVMELGAHITNCYSCVCAGIH